MCKIKHIDFKVKKIKFTTKEIKINQMLNFVDSKKNSDIFLKLCFSVFIEVVFIDVRMCIPWVIKSTSKSLDLQ